MWPGIEGLNEPFHWQVRGRPKRGREKFRGFETGSALSGAGAGGSWVVRGFCRMVTWDSVCSLAGEVGQTPGTMVACMWGGKVWHLFQDSHRSSFKEGSVMGWFSDLNVENGLVLAKWEARQVALVVGQIRAERGLGWSNCSRVHRYNRDAGSRARQAPGWHGCGGQEGFRADSYTGERSPCWWHPGFYHFHALYISQAFHTQHTPASPSVPAQKSPHHPVKQSSYPVTLALPCLIHLLST